MGLGSLFSSREASSAAAKSSTASQSSNPPAPASSAAKAKAKTASAASEAKDKASATMDQIKVIITGDKSTTTSGASLESVTSSCPSLSKKQRLAGFAFCFVIGYIISFGSTFALIAGDDNGAKFGITYTLGNVIALCGSGFLVGPCQQMKLMMKPVRRVAAIIYLVMIVVVLSVAIAAPHLGGLVLFLVFVQLLAAIWYSASYVPFGRKIITGVCTKVCGGAVGS